MYFELHSLPAEFASTTCYFRLHSDQAVLYSPFYPDRRSALAAMEKLVLQLRAEQVGNSPLAETKKNWTPTFFGKQHPAVGTGLVVEDEGKIHDVRLAWHEAAKATTFRIEYWELADQVAGMEALTDLELAETDQDYNWVAMGSSVLHVDSRKLLGMLPSVGVQANLARTPCEPIFNALQPFVSADLPLFHGRSKDVDEVYTLLKNRVALLLYGGPRVGKTSLLQCGLANKLQADTEKLVVVKKGSEDLMTSIATALREALPEGAQLPETDDPLLLTEMLEKQCEQRHFLVFDQLEHLFDPAIYDDERIAFFQFVRKLVDKNSPLLRVVLVLRETFLAAIAEYESEMPALLDNRFRLLPLKQGSMVDASVNLLDVLKAKDKLAVKDSQGVAEKVCAQLTNDRGEVPMQCLQIYLHQLHQKSCQETTPGEAVPLDAELVDRMGPASALIDDFLGQRIRTLQEQLPGPKEPRNPALEREIQELEDSRVHCGCKEKKNLVAGGAIIVPPPTNNSWWWLLAPLALIPLAFLTFWWWAQPEPLPAACQAAIDANTCEAYVDYLCNFGDTSACAQGLLATLEANDCRVWEDYQDLQLLDDCAAYQDFYRKYRNSGICMDHIRAKLLDWECPLVRDTVQLTVRDTIIKRQTFAVPAPGTYGSTPAIPTGNYGPEGPPCKTFGTTNFKRIGPIWVMTEALSGGPYRWEDALDACSARGWRLPCVGEIDYLIEKIYRDDPDRAYAMLTGTSECYLINPLEAEQGRIEFWTATEADDAAAWTYVFDIAAQTIRRESATPKSARLPCLCVQKEPNQQGSGLPPCYQKQIDRRPAN